jgi:predicted  nucleic acid-binding Zn-ribbon protein
MELEASTEAALQERHELGLKLQTRLGVEAALLGELDSLREAVRQQEAAAGAAAERATERWEHREETWRARAGEAEASLAAGEVRERGLRDQLELAGRQLTEAVQPAAGGNNSFSGEVAELQAAQAELVAERQGLRAELQRAGAEAEAGRAEAVREAARAGALASELEEAQCEVTAYCRQAERAREEVQGLEQQLESERQGRLDGQGKGNSLFREVEDRREKVEAQLKVYEEKFDLLKENYDVKMAQLQKTKMHNAQLLGLVGGRGGGDSEQTSRLEELLTAERATNRQLGDRLDALERAGGGGPAPGQVWTVILSHHTSPTSRWWWW